MNQQIKWGKTCDYKIFNEDYFVVVQLLRMSMFKVVELKIHKQPPSKILKLKDIVLNI